MLMSVREIYALFQESTGICTDTRLLRSGQIYLALVGERFDGNEFALAALEAGAAFSIVSDRTLAQADHRCIYQPNTLTTLHRLAAVHRNLFGGLVLGITGSNGKTTSKELLVAVLRQKYKVVGTKGNLNNHIGVPLTILGLTIQDEIAVIEMGANHPGEIKLLCAIADPDHGYITNVGKAHLEGFGTLAAVRETKLALYHHVVNKRGNGRYFLNSDEASLSEYIDVMHPRVSGFSSGQFSNVSVSPQVSFEWPAPTGSLTVRSLLYGKHNFTNIVAALSIAEFLGLSKDEILLGLSSYQASTNRSQVIDWEGLKVYLDAYNANPTSVAASLVFFDELDAERKILVLGDMLETGAEVKEVHREILTQVSEMELTHVFLVGEIFESISADFDTSSWSFGRSLHKVRESLLVLPAGSTIYLKGSRAIGLEKIIAPASDMPRKGL